MISIDGNKTFAQLAVEGKDGKQSFLEKETEPISEYMLKQLGIDIAKLKDTEKNLLLKNFVHLMCNVLSDIKLVNNRLIQYQEKYDKCKNDKSNVAEYYRRKIEHFCKINKEALTEIMDFLQNRIGNYIMENRFDTLAREENGENLSTFFLKRRYKIAQFPEYFDLDYNYATIVKVNYLPDIDFMDKMNVEKEFLSLYQTDKEQYYQKLHKEVDDKKIMDWNLARVENNYHLNKRTEIFQDLAKLFYNKHYQSFLSLGLLQLEGLFYDICQIKYGIKDNMGTLVEKVQKSLSTRNEFSFMRFYPYFAFDVPIQRKDIAKEQSRVSVWNYNTIVMGIHNYYEVATHVNKDLDHMSQHITRVLYNRLRRDWKPAQKSDLAGALKERYGSYNPKWYKAHNMIIIPIYAWKHRYAIQFNQKICPYTKEGRKLLHDNLKNVESSMLIYF